MKRYVAKKEELETTSQIGKFCGFVASDNIKGYLVYVGGYHTNLNAVLANSTSTVPNTSCGAYVHSSFSSVEDFVQNANKKFLSNGVGVEVKDIYFFDTLKEMHKWLSE